jgi:antitoxin ParD1/3/4
MTVKTTSISLDDHFTRFVETPVGLDRHASDSDVLQAGLRLLEEQEAKLTPLRAAPIEGEHSGSAAPFDFEAFIAPKRGFRSSAG